MLNQQLLIETDVIGKNVQDVLQRDRHQHSLDSNWELISNRTNQFSTVDHLVFSSELVCKTSSCSMIVVWFNTEQNMLHHSALSPFLRTFQNIDSHIHLVENSSCLSNESFHNWEKTLSMGEIVKTKTGVSLANLI